MRHDAFNGQEMAHVLNNQQTDDIIKHRYVYQPHEDVMHRVQTQVNEEAILRQNEQRRAMTQRKMEWGRMVATVPIVVMQRWAAQHPELMSQDKTTRSAKLMELIKQNPQYWVTEKV